jgi:hypothetical protein
VVVDEESAAYFSASDVMPRSELAARAGSGSGARRRRHFAFGGARGCEGRNADPRRQPRHARIHDRTGWADLYPALEAIEKEHYIVDSRSMLRGSLIRAADELVPRTPP